MDDDPELQRALLLSLGAEVNSALPPSVSGEHDTSQDPNEDAELQQALLLSHSASSNVKLLHGDSYEDVASLSLAAPDVRKLLLTVVNNLERALEADCDPAEAVRFKQLNDDIVRKRADRTDSPEISYSLISNALIRLGFKLECVTGEVNSAETSECRRWFFSDANVDSKLFPAFRNVLQTEKRKLPTELSAGYASAKDHTPAPSKPQGPQTLDDFESLRVPPAADTPALRVLVYPKGFAYLVKAPDCVAWACATKSGRSHWGSHGRPGEDDRVVLTLYNGVGIGRSGCALHWYDHKGDEQIRPSLSCHQGQWRWCETYMKQVFVLRLIPQQDVVLAGLMITGRPFHTNGHLMIMVQAESSCAAVPFEACQILTQLPEDGRKAPEAQQGRRPAPPPPSAKHFR